MQQNCYCKNYKSSIIFSTFLVILENHLNSGRKKNRSKRKTILNQKKTTAIIVLVIIAKYRFLTQAQDIIKPKPIEKRSKKEE